MSYKCCELIWYSLQQNDIDADINEWRQHADGQLLDTFCELYTRLKNVRTNKV